MQGFRVFVLACVFSLCLILPAGAQNYLRPVSLAALHHPRNTYSVIQHIQWNVAKRLRSQFERHGIKYTPQALTVIALKEEGLLELWVKNEGRWVFIRSYPILAASGDAGPKLREGDYQVPEGIYRLTQLNPNSHYHLSVRVDYPNAFDRQVAASEGRHNLGGDIMLHGREKSRGCIAIGDIGIEEIFYLIHKIGLSRSQIIIAPYDMRNRYRPLADHVRPWIPTLYQQIQTAMSSYRQ
jgi:murein L,D-transpeptidase YafK